MTDLKDKKTISRFIMSPETKQMTMTAIRTAWPAVLESFFVSLAGMIDTMMVSTLGSAAVAAVGLTVQPKFIGLCPFMALNMAVSAFVARRKGEEKRDDANEIVLTSLALLLILCAVVSFISLTFSEQIIRLAGSSEDTHADAVIYFRIIMGGIIFNTLQLMFNAAQRGAGNTRISMTTNIASSLTNIVFNYLLIGGHFGFPALGITGAALATVLGTVVGAGMSIMSVCRKDSFVNIPHIIRNHLRCGMGHLKAVLGFASSIMTENLLMRIGFLTTAVIAARLGTEQFAAHNVGMSILSLAFSFADGMQAAGVALAGQALGAGEKQKARKYGTICQHIGLCVSLVLALMLFFGGRAFYSLYFEEEHIIEYGVLITRYVMVIVLLQISQVIYSSCLRAAGDVRYTLVASVTGVTFVRSISTYVLTSVLGLGLHGIWLGVFCDQFTRLLLMGIRFRQGKWVDIKI